MTEGDEHIGGSKARLARLEIDRKMSSSTIYGAPGIGSRKTTVRSVFIESLSLLAKRKNTWSPSLLAGVLWRAFANLGRHREMVRVLKLPAFADLARNDPRFAFKYLMHDYLARRLTVAERASCFVHHYSRLHAIVSDSLLRQTMHQEISLLHIGEGGNCFDITMSLSRPHDNDNEMSYDLQHDKEGELSLYLQVNGEGVFVLSFTIVPGWVVKSKAADVLLITRLQGMKGCYRQISLATKALHDVAPGALLVSALQGVAEAFGVGEIASICATGQSSYCADCAASFKSAFDDFFAGLGVVKNDADFFVSALPLQEKPLVQVKQGHKLRTKEKRVFKRYIADAVCRLLREGCRDHHQLATFSVVSPSGGSLRDRYADS